MKSIKHLSHIIPALIIFGGIYLSNTNFETTSEKIVAATLIVFANGYVTYWTSYMSKRAENKAMSEDIKELTSTAETIKQSLAISSANKISIQTLKRDATIKFYENLLNWLDNLNIVDIADEHFEDTFRRLETLQSHYTSAESKLKLFDSKFDSYEPTVKIITFQLFLIQLNYRAHAYRLNSIRTKVELGAVIIKDFDRISEECFDKINPEIIKLTKILRESIDPSLY